MQAKRTSENDLFAPRMSTAENTANSIIMRSASTAASHPLMPRSAPATRPSIADASIAAVCAHGLPSIGSGILLR
ncbi:hypothetical protein AUQ37_04940 [Candidatus Methanomethylophilus sp. 1R26]|uniref:hypothetical protein n=1 Tax=Candidatus Methanomethylophilus sp. 1R26 TaxID=1769296 RepID=UPI000737864C|nr:hypothetical protein [Candidatus Methanomethylophilus sp. 1R26]KUE74334.1 hypothetical protein AUQ37_04940 [Candidatus Methanomethylophilus sp. 1R26]